MPDTSSQFSTDAVARTDLSSDDSARREGGLLARQHRVEIGISGSGFDRLTFDRRRR